MMATDAKIEPGTAAKSGIWARVPRRVVIWAKRVGIAIGLLGVAATLAIVFTIRHYEADLPSIAELKSYNPPQLTRVLARDGTLLGELFVERRTVVPIEAIPNRMKLT